MTSHSLSYGLFPLYRNSSFTLTLTGKLCPLEKHFCFNVKCLWKANTKVVFQKVSPLFFSVFLISAAMFSYDNMKKKIKKFFKKQKPLMKTLVKICWIKTFDVLLSWMNSTILFWKQGKHSWSPSTKTFWSFRSDYHKRPRKRFTPPEMTAGTMQKSIMLHEVVTYGCHVPSEYQQMPTHPVGTKDT